jgi:hypothetical protein
MFLRNYSQFFKYIFLKLGAKIVNPWFKKFMVGQKKFDIKFSHLKKYYLNKKMNMKLVSPQGDIFFLWQNFASV